jgi:hypothetical protein
LPDPVAMQDVRVERLIRIEGSALIGNKIPA